jgi:hypothetical protein
MTLAPTLSSGNGSLALGHALLGGDGGGAWQPKVVATGLSFHSRRRLLANTVAAGIACFDAWL